jgi:hypothetical protein
MEITMESLTIDTRHLLNARRRALSNVKVCSPRQIDSDEGELLTGASKGGDRSYWIDYDYYINEREERAMRRARVYSSILEFGKRLLLHRVGLRARTAIHDHNPA